MKWLLAAAVIAVAMLHQDLWFWRDRTLILGFLPVGLAYHMAYAVLASATLWAMVRWAWPAHLEDDGPPRP